MSREHVLRARRNARLMSATGLLIGGLFLFPTSTNTGPATARPGTATAGVVPATTPGPATAPTSLVINGPVENTRYGPVQVQVVLRSGRLITAHTLIYPQASGRDREINAYAIPVLEQEAVQAQNAQVDTVSGATYTSDGYVRSLQAALDLAHHA
ncbi:MAG: FMN-binding protein [Mycobacteriales bacterium]